MIIKFLSTFLCSNVVTKDNKYTLSFRAGRLFSNLTLVAIGAGAAAAFAASSGAFSGGQNGR
jgi:hypothetical protein